MEDNFVLLKDYTHRRLFQMSLNDSTELQGIHISIVDYVSGILYNPLTRMIVMAAMDTSHILTVSLDGRTEKLMADVGKIFSIFSVSRNMAIWKSRGIYTLSEAAVFNTSLGTWRMLMHWKNHVRSLLLHKNWQHLLHFAFFLALFCFALSPMSLEINLQVLCSF